MSEKRFTTDYSDFLKNTKTFIKMDNERLTYEEIVDLLNELSDDNRQLKKLLKGNNEKFGKCWDRIYSLEKENEQLKERLEKINNGYGHLTHRKGLTANEWLIESQERELKKKNEQISDWIKQHSKDIVKIGEQKATIKSKDKQLERLYNYFQDYLKDEMSGNSFSEMWDFVKENESWEDE